jgi:zinc transport system permease protein
MRLRMISSCVAPAAGGTVRTTSAASPALRRSAKATGIRTARINKVLVLLSALTVVLAMKLVGILLISALLILPPVTALQVARGFKSTIVISSAAGITSVVLGIVLSFLVNLPTGATIVIINFIFFLASFAYRHWKY